MSNIFELLHISLSLFDGEGGTGGEAAPMGGTSGGSVSAQQSNTGEASPAQGEAAESPDAGENGNGQGDHPKAMTPEERKAAYKEFKAEYKDEYARDFQREFNKRFRDHKTLQDQNAKYKAVADRLFDRYGITDGDIDALGTALDNDRAYIAAAAEERGIDPDMYKREMDFRRSERERQETQREYAEYRRQQEAKAQYKAWSDEAKALGGENGKYPGLDIDAELENEDFCHALRLTGSVEKAYAMAHMDQILQDTIQRTRQQAEKQVADNIRAKGNRPAENGSSSPGSSVSIGTDYMHMSRKEFLAHKARVMRGEAEI